MRLVRRLLRRLLKPSKLKRGRDKWITFVLGFLPVRVVMKDKLENDLQGFFESGLIPTVYISRKSADLQLTLEHELQHARQYYLSIPVHSHITSDDILSFLTEVDAVAESIARLFPQRGYTWVAEEIVNSARIYEGFFGLRARFFANAVLRSFEKKTGIKESEAQKIREKVKALIKTTSVKELYPEDFIDTIFMELFGESIKRLTEGLSHSTEANDHVRPVKVKYSTGNRKRPVDPREYRIEVIRARRKVIAGTDIPLEEILNMSPDLLLELSKRIPDSVLEEWDNLIANRKSHNSARLISSNKSSAGGEVG